MSTNRYRVIFTKGYFDLLPVECSGLILRLLIPLCWQFLRHLPAVECKPFPCSCLNTVYSKCHKLLRINVPTNLSIGNTDESLIDQFVPQWVPGLSLHDVALCCFISKRDGWYLEEEKGKRDTSVLFEILIGNFTYIFLMCVFITFMKIWSFCI